MVDVAVGEESGMVCLVATPDWASTGEEYLEKESIIAASAPIVNPSANTSQRENVDLLFTVLPFRL